MLTFLITFCEWGGYFPERKFNSSDGGWLSSTVFSFLGVWLWCFDQNKLKQALYINFLVLLPRGPCIEIFFDLNLNNFKLIIKNNQNNLQYHLSIVLNHHAYVLMLDANNYLILIHQSTSSALIYIFIH